MNIQIKDTTKGYILVLVSVLAIANVYIFSKAALNIVHISQFGVYWFGIAIIYNLLFNRNNNNLKKFKEIKKSSIKIIVIIGLLELISTSLFFISIKTMNNPALVSFFANSTPVLVSIMGIFILKEKFKSFEIIGIILAILGALIIGFQPGTEVPEDFYSALVLILVSGLFFAISTILSKKHIKQISASVLTLNRALFLFIGSILFLVFSKQTLVISKEAFLYISVGSLLGPFLAALAGYAGLKYIEASRVSVLGSSKAMFVLITSFLYFKIIPSEIQLIGGFITIFGVLLISLGKLYKSKTVKAPAKQNRN